MPEIIEWYRPSPFPKMIRVGFVSGAIMMGGVFMMAMGIDATPLSFVKNTEAWIGVGMLFVTGGVGSTVYGVWRIHSENEVYLQLERKGLVYVHQNQEIAIAWQAISDISSEKNQLLIRYDTDKTLAITTRFIGINHEKLCTRLLEVKRKTLLGIAAP